MWKLPLKLILIELSNKNSFKKIFYDQTNLHRDMKFWAVIKILITHLIQKFHQNPPVNIQIRADLRFWRAFCATLPLGMNCLWMLIRSNLLLAGHLRVWDHGRKRSGPQWPADGRRSHRFGNWMSAVTWPLHKAFCPFSMNEKVISWFFNFNFYSIYLT